MNGNTSRIFCQIGRAFANGPGDLGLTLSNIRYVSRVKWSNPGKGVVSSPTPCCKSYWKGSLLVALDYGCQLYDIKIDRNKTISLTLLVNKQSL